MVLLSIKGVDILQLYHATSRGFLQPQTS